MKKGLLKSPEQKFRNLRDIVQYSNPNVRSSLLFRSSDLSAYENDPMLSSWLREQGIKTIIDLRNNGDIMRRTYSQRILRNINYYNIKLVSKETETQFIGRDNAEYYSWVLESEGDKLKAIFLLLSIKNSFPLVIHCHIGMDRTGIVLALIHLLLNSSREKIIEDYLASGPNMKQELIDLILRSVDNYGGIGQYLNRIGITNSFQAKILRNLVK